MKSPDNPNNFRYSDRIPLCRSMWGVPAKRQDISNEQVERWARLRQESRERHKALLDEAPEDPLDALAWKSGAWADDGHTFDNDLRERIELARAQRFTWREIAAALGEGEDPVSAQRVADKQHWRNKSFKQA
ncbi:MAG: hypothetical protein AAF657_30185 [Acidobacteriota bacterium]